MKTLTGYLREVSDHTHYMDCGEDNMPFVYFYNQDRGNVPVNRLIALSVDDRYHVPRENNFTLLNEPMADKFADQRIMLARLVAEDSTDEQMAEHQSIVDDHAKRLQEYYLYYLRGKVSVEVRGFVIRYEGRNEPPYYVQGLMQRHLEAQGIDWKPTHWHGWGGQTSRRVCGLGDLGGNKAATYYPCGHRTHVHEHGHNCNLGHAGRLKADGTILEYGDKSCIMGSMQDNVEGFHTYNLYRLGAYEDRELKIVDHTQELLIAPIEMPYHGMHPDEYQHVLIRVPQHDNYMISIRKTKGTLYPQGVAAEGALYIHQIVDNIKTRRFEPDISPGGEKLLPNGVTIKYLEYANETAHVQVLFEDEGFEPELKISHDFPDPLPSKQFELTHAGAWDNIAGQGLDVHIRMNDGRLQATLKWYTYTSNGSGLPIYYMATGFVEDGVLECDLYSTEGGSWDDPTTYLPVLVGEVQLYFLNDEVGIFNYNTVNYGRGGFEVTPVVLTDDDRDGAYFDRSKDGSGCDFRFFERDGIKHCTGFWYVFDDLKRQRWFTLQGIKDIDDAYRINIREFLGGRWMAYDKPYGEIVGSATLSGPIFSYNIKTAQVEGAGTLTLEKLF